MQFFELQLRLVLDGLKDAAFFAIVPVLAVAQLLSGQDLLGPLCAHGRRFDEQVDLFGLGRRYTGRPLGRWTERPLSGFRGTVLGFALALEAKLLLDAVRDGVLSHLAGWALFFDLVGAERYRGQALYGLVAAGGQFEDWVNLYGKQRPALATR